jgi:hypothetical protein
MVAGVMAGRSGRAWGGPRLATLLAGFALVTASCASRLEERKPPVTEIPIEQVTPSPPESVPSALEDPFAEGLPKPPIARGELVAGGPPPDGIPPIDRPVFEKASEAGWLAEREAVLAFSLAGEERAYPVQVMIWHEIVNDTVGGIPVAVTYCPLCNSAVAFDRRLEERVLDFGTSGKLWRSALVMYDRQTQSLWSHFTGQSIAGVLTGETLESFPVSTVSWSAWRNAHPDGLVLNRNTGFSRDYGRNPYIGYDEPRARPFLFRGDPDRRLQPKTRIVGIVVGGESVAVVLEPLARARVIELEARGQPLVVWSGPGVASALDRAEVAEGRIVGETGVFDPVVDGRRLRFVPHGDQFADVETRSTWSVLGRGVSGPHAGKALRAIEHIDTFWFAWAAFQPDTRIVRGEQRGGGG